MSLRSPHAGVLVLVALFVASSARAQDVRVETVPPVVVKTVPEAGTTDADPGLTEIKVTFSKEMRDGTWSWAFVNRNAFPPTSGKPKYLEDKRTCVLPVKLQPGKTYALWVNTQGATNFKDAAGQSAVPYLLVFKTKG